MCFSRNSSRSCIFSAAFSGLGVVWFCGIRVTSERLIQHYVANGYGIGLTVAAPGFKPPSQLRALPVPNFPAVVVGVAWCGKLSHITRQLLARV